jgi:hypothetical protein
VCFFSEGSERVFGTPPPPPYKKGLQGKMNPGPRALGISLVKWVGRGTPA